jgi:hypothetical protein
MPDGPWTYDLNSDVGKVRLLIRDTDVDGTWLFADDEVQAFLDLSAGDVFSAAADAIGAILASKSLLAKVVSIGDYSESTVSVGLQLRSLMSDLRERANSVPADEYAQTIWDSFSWRNKVVNDRIGSVVS